MRQAVFMVFLLSSLALAGCLDGPSVDTDGYGSTSESELLLPTWSVGDQWLYTFSTPQFDEDSARLVVAELDEDDGVYQLGISSEREAQRHAVINHNPFLGRITLDGLSVFEEGEAQQVFNFPWALGDTWMFTLLGQQWSATTVSIYDGVVEVQATSSDGHRLDYAFSGRAGFLDSFVWSDDDGVEQLRMQLNQVNTGYEGDVHFYRARDLLDNVYESTDNDVYDSFLDSGHPDGSEWDALVWYIDATIAGGGSGSLTMNDHTGASPLIRTWGSGATESGTIGTVPSTSGDYSLTVNLRGQSSMLHFRVAGAIVTQWTL